METGKRIIITGGGSGLGKHMAYDLLSRGYEVAVSYAHSKKQAEELRERAEAQLGKKLFIYHADFNQKDAMKNFFDAAVEALGGVDLMVNNSADTSAGFEVFDITDENLDAMYAVNFRSGVIAMREAGKYMAEHGIKGSIINISSIHGRMVWPADAVYGAFKAGWERIIRSFALSLAPYDVRINCIALGAFRNKTLEEAVASGSTPEAYHGRDNMARGKIALRRLGEPKDLVELLLFLASEKATYITGETVTIDGGISIPCIPEGKPVDGKPIPWAAVKPRDF
ncbi:MAG: SDR family NAD(P)-dependent oxidoreductase [Christensenellales bacterium]|jgi:hypothetical protein